jgi:hypothetical protein
MLLFGNGGKSEKTMLFAFSAPNLLPNNLLNYCIEPRIALCVCDIRIDEYEDKSG